jgi:hypothetical protein
MWRDVHKIGSDGGSSASLLRQAWLSTFWIPSSAEKICERCFDANQILF